MTEEEKTAYIKKLVQSNVDQHNKIVDLSKKVYDLQKESYRKEAQIEKMKCCANCKHSRTEYEHCKTNKHEKWEIKND